MSTTPRHGLPFIWPTWVTGLLSGDKHCAWSAWYRAHFRYEKRPDDSFDFAAWSADHNALVLRRKSELEAGGWSVSIEAQNDFRWKGQTAIVSGKPDLISTRGTDVLVSDCKTGRGRHSDWWQVLLYMAALRKVRPALPPARGEVVYPDQTILIAAEELTPDREAQLFAMFRSVAGDAAPARVPSAHECRFCDIADCPDRFVEAAEGAAETQAAEVAF
jgi:hypothetical protein